MGLSCGPEAGTPWVTCALDSAPLVRTLFPRPRHSWLALPAAHSAWGLLAPCLHVVLPSTYVNVTRVVNLCPSQ